MNSSLPLNMSATAVFIAGIVQLAFLVWIIAFPIIIIRKLNRLIDLTKHKQ